MHATKGSTPRSFSITTPEYDTAIVHFPVDMRGIANDSDDPLTLALAPPPNETPEERTNRLGQEAEAQRISDEIDEALKRERAALKRRKVMKMLLLGQSESGAC